MTPHGHFHWNELMTRDVPTAKAFYENAMGWSFDGMPMPEGGTYWVAMADGKPAGGVFAMDGPQFEGVPEHWMSYIAVDDVDARAEKAVANGAEIVQPVFDVPGVGRIVMLRQPGGGVIGWITPAE